MSAIYGYIANQSIIANHKTIVQKMNLCMATRGPNSNGHVILNSSNTGNQDKKNDFNILLGHLRLAIIDTSSDSHQPMQIDEGDYAITYDGVIYNYIELKSVLKQRGHSFKTRGDTEVLLHAYKEWGYDCVNHIEGMFAFALFDRSKNVLFCARDPFGIKPLYYSQHNNNFCFASDTSAMLQFPWISNEPNIQTVYDYLWCGQTKPGTETFFKQIQKLAPAHFMVIDTKTAQPIQLECYWKPHLETTKNITFKDATDKLRHLFECSVKKHLRCDLPLGCALSGGIDSSSIACMVRHIEPDIPINTFSYVAPESEINEYSWAKLVEKRINSNAHYISATSAEFNNDLNTLIQTQGEPFGSTSIYAQRRVFESFRANGVMVSLDGQGADELLGGYTGYSGARIASLVLKGRIDKAITYLYKALRGGINGRSMGRMIYETAYELIPHRVSSLGTQLLLRGVTAPWLNKEIFANVNKGGLPDINKFSTSPYRLRRALAYALTTQGLEDLLGYADRNSMAFSIESRVPFLTRELADFTLSLPEKHLVDDDGVTKAVFREAMRGIVPDEILNRRDKIGFATPEFTWLKELSPMIDNLLLDSHDSRYIDISKVKADWQAMKRGDISFNWRMWRCVNFLTWQKIFNVR